MDENFLLYRRRALRLLELMEAHDKAWSLQVFSSARVLRSYSVDQLVRLGLSWLWLGLEGENSAYTKLDGVDTFELVRDLQADGVRILGFDDHRAGAPHAGQHRPRHRLRRQAPDGLPSVHAVLAESGDALLPRTGGAGQLKSQQQFPWSDWHGQKAFSWHHPWIRDGQETDYIVRAFERDLEANGPSVLRVMRTMLKGWKRYKDHADLRVRHRFLREAGGMGKADYRRGGRGLRLLP